MSRYRCPYCRSPERPEWRSFRNPFVAVVQVLIVVGGLATIIPTLLYGMLAAAEGNLLPLLVPVGAFFLTGASVFYAARLFASRRQVCPDCGVVIGH
jgi:hypothetical protein